MPRACTNRCGRAACHARARRYFRRWRGGQARRGGDASALVPRACRRDPPAWTRTRSAPRSRMCSRTRARSSSPPARSPLRESKNTWRARTGAAKRLVAINSGANMNFDRLRHVAERADLGGEREALLAVEIPEQPGSFLRFCEALGSTASPSSITAMRMRAAAQIFVGFAISQGRTRARRSGARSLRDAGYSITDMTDNEMAKLHVRYMVGGHARGIENELPVPLRISGAPGRAAEVSAGRRHALEHQPVPLPQPWLGLWPGAGRHPGRRRRSGAQFLDSPARAALRVRGRNQNPAYRMFLGA